MNLHLAPKANVTLYVVSFAVISLCMGCQKKHFKSAEIAPKGETGKVKVDTQMRKKVVAKVGYETITVGDVADALNQMSPYIRVRYRSPEKRRELLDNLIDFKLLVQEAKKLNLDKEPELQRIHRHLMIEQMLKDEIDSQLSESLFSEAQLRQFYDTHRKEFVKPEEVRVYHILVPTLTLAQDVLRKAKQQKGSLETFEQLAKAYSVDKETRDKGGDLNFFSRDPSLNSKPIAPEIIEASFRLKEPGAIYPQPVKTPQGFHVLFLARRRDALSRTFEEAKRFVQNRMLRDERERRIQSLLAKLRETTPVVENKEALRELAQSQL